MPDPAEHERRGITERMDVEPEPDATGHIRLPPRIVWASSRSLGWVSLRFRRLALDQHDASAVGFDERGVVGVDATGLMRRAERVGAKRLRRLHHRPGRRAEPSRPPDRPRRVSTCRRPATPAPHRRRRRPPPARPARTALADASGRAASCTTTTSMSAGTNASPARTESERVAPPIARLHARRALPADVRREYHHTPSRTPTTPRQPPGRSHSRVRDARTAWPCRSATLPRPQPRSHKSSYASVLRLRPPASSTRRLHRNIRPPDLRLASIAATRCRGGRTPTDRCWSAPPR